MATVSSLSSLSPLNDRVILSPIIKSFSVLRMEHSLREHLAITKRVGEASTPFLRSRHTLKLLCTEYSIQAMLHWWLGGWELLRIADRPPRRLRRVRSLHCLSRNTKHSDPSMLNC
ncbi:hypothetical protein PV11_01267 [Exophiala sideris]|uniref:Uncharacterized protein n=1 Tax=Exophiala sideris TaxID=1016849 RepID=A0A0D1YVP9_9EURO|nr:hypothetical protein PV11_01267 [Exophiala sideris]